MSPAFKHYRKATPTIARPLTSVDYVERGGVIQTLEGTCSFMPGDYLGRDAKGEFRIGRETILDAYIQQGEADAEGWYQFQALDLRQACQMAESFTIRHMTGKPGDYWVKSQTNEWVVDREIFEASYRPIDG